MKIKVILPIISDHLIEPTVKEVEHYASKTTKISVTNLDYGPESIESEYDEALAIPNFLEKAQEAEKNGYQGIISDCMADPGVKAAREIVDIPVVGPGESAMHFASSLAQSFSIITVLPNVLSILDNLSKEVGLDSKLASIRSVDVPVLDIGKDDTLFNSLYEEMVLAVEEDQAHSLVLGCTGFTGLASDLQERLRESGYDVPVIDPMFAATRMLEGMIAMNVKQSRLTYMTPPIKQRIKQ